MDDLKHIASGEEKRQKRREKPPCLLNDEGKNMYLIRSNQEREQGKMVQRIITCTMKLV